MIEGDSLPGAMQKISKSFGGLRIAVTGGLSFFLFLGGVSPTAAQAPDSARPVHWSYEAADGPAKWASLSPAYATCGSGKSQSPVDLTPANAKGDSSIVKLAYNMTALRMTHYEQVDDIIDNGHTIQISVVEGGSLTTTKDNYELKQFHFHTPSEHTLDGKHYPMEVHFVHQSKAGNLAVIGMFVEEGADNTELAKLLNHLPAAKGESVHRPDVTLNPAAHLPSELPSLNYSGSLTTPPCSEGVEWFVHRHPRSAGKAQIAAIAERIGSNNRPVQPINGREQAKVDVQRTVTK